MGNAALLRKLRQEAVAQGLCGTCQIYAPRSGLKICDSCLAWGKAKRQEYRAAGRCICGRTIADLGFKQCRKCRRRRRAQDARYKQRLIAEGRCLRHRYVPVMPGHLHCGPCLEAMAQRSRERERERNGGYVKARRCSICGATDHIRNRHDRTVAPVHGVFTLKSET